MDWEAFQRDHHRPHLMIVSIEAKGKASPSRVKAGFERLAIKLRSSGNYAFKREGTTVYASFEDDADAARFAAVLQPKQTTRESDWASKALVHMDDAAYLRIAAMIKGRRLRRKLTPR
jgi:hypothetical protein